MNIQRDKFQLDDDQIYLNGAYMSPLLKSSEEAAIEGLKRMRFPGNFTKDDFFESVNQLRIAYAKLIQSSDPQRIVVTPSASYALANVVKNLPENGRKEIILLEEQFPSNYYVWQKRAKEDGFTIKIINRPKDMNQSWTEHILEAISYKTLVISMPVVHWGDGYRFDITSISHKVRESGALLVIDGTQSIGALPYNQEQIQADALIVSSYKWLLGPYNSGLAYMGAVFDNGSPIEESWLNRINSEDFQHLTDYQEVYRGGARRYEVGEAPDFIKIPMMHDGIRQINDWGVEHIQQYCQTLISPIINTLKDYGYRINDKNMAYHLFGIRCPETVVQMQLKQQLSDANISISLRKEAIRVSPNVYNSEKEVLTFMEVLLQAIK